MDQWLRDAAADAALMDDFRAVCGFGGRRSGSGQDEAAMDWALGRLAEVGAGVSRQHAAYDGWRCRQAALSFVEERGPALRCNPLLRSASTGPQGLVAEVLDLGQGREEDFARAGEAVRGKIVLVRHEYPFSPTHMHRRRKYDLAVARGAAGFLIANPIPGGGVLSGSSGRPRDGAGIPAAYIDHESAQRIVQACATRGGPAVAVSLRLLIEGEEIADSKAAVGFLDLPGGRDSRIVISAHMDGHDLGVSALDNGTGVAVALAAARALAPRVGQDTPGLRICFFCAEEWALAGSARYLADLPDGERSRMKLNINLDTVAGDETLTALISGFPALAGHVARAAALAQTPVGSWLPLMPNSDHANFARHGIPALRLTAGFDRPDSRVNNILSAGDVPAVVEESELRRAVAVTCALADIALRMTDEQLEALALVS